MNAPAEYLKTLGNASKKCRVKREILSDLKTASEIYSSIRELDSSEKIKKIGEKIEKIRKQLA